MDRKKYGKKSRTKRLEQKITGRSKGMTLSRRKRKRLKYKEKVQTERKGILGSQQRGSAALRIMSQKKLREMFGVKQGGTARRRRRREKDGLVSGSQCTAS